MLHDKGHGTGEQARQGTFRRAEVIERLDTNLGHDDVIQHPARVPDAPAPWLDPSYRRGADQTNLIKSSSSTGWYGRQH